MKDSMSRSDMTFFEWLLLVLCFIVLALLALKANASPKINVGNQVSGWASYTQPYGIFSDPNYSVFSSVAVNQIQSYTPPGGFIRLVAGPDQIPQDTTTTNDTPLPLTNVERITVTSAAALANQLQARLWTGVPVNCLADISSSETIKQSYAYRKGFALGKLLDPKHKYVEFEYSNELWNAGDQTNGTANLFRARADSTLTTPDDFGRCGQEAFKQWMLNMIAFEQGVKDSGSTLQVKGRAPGFIANAYFAQKGIEWIKAQNNSTMNRLLTNSRIILAPYAPGTPSDIGGIEGKTPQQIADQSVQFAEIKFPTWISDNVALAKASGMEGIAYYETMGLSTYSDDPAILALNRTDPAAQLAEYQIFTLVADLADGVLDSKNSDPEAELAIFGSGGIAYSGNGQWSPKEFYGGPITPKEQGILDFVRDSANNSDVPSPSSSVTALCCLNLLASARPNRRLHNHA